mmetsp:Transcript_8455/g.9708  ORF Transcript_8455/g.9708 Transcript_8455/m.9708 type:complete len:404 (+) Transcript_8455:60-1271(+)
MNTKKGDRDRSNTTFSVRGKSRANNRLIRGFSLIIIFAVIYYGSLLNTLQSATRENDVDYDTLLWKPKNGEETTSKVDVITEMSKPIDSPTNNNLHSEVKLPSAKSILTSRPPFNNSDIIKLYADDTDSQAYLIQSDNCVVTSYFRVPSKFKPGRYDGWMRNMLSLQDAMVIFTQPDLVNQIKDLRNHALNRTVIIPLSLEDLPFSKLFPASFWQDQLERDPEKGIHRSYQLFWIWLSKSWCVTQAIRINVYDSDLFVWSDIGCFREKNYNSKTMIMHREQVPPHEMLQMAHHRPNPPKDELFNNKYKHKTNFYHSGSQFAGYKKTWIQFHEYFLDTIDRFLQKNMIIVEDQAVLQSTCLSHPDICAYAPFNQVKDNHYFGLRHILHFGGDYNYWRYEKNKVR